MFIVECQKNQAKVRQTEPITSGSKNVYVVQFNLSEEWDSLVATAVFMAGNRIINVLLDEDRECMIPWEVMQYAGEQVMVGVFGTMDGNVVLPTIWASMGNLQQGVTTGIPQGEPTPSAYVQVLNELQKIKKQIQDGIPYALDAIVDQTVISVNDVSDLVLPRQLIMLNSSFKALDGEHVSYINAIVYLENVQYLDDNNFQKNAIRITDYDGNVYDFFYNPDDESKQFFTMMQIRNGDIRNDYELARSQGFSGTLDEWLDSLKGSPGKDGLDALYYVAGVVPYNSEDEIGNLFVWKGDFSRDPVIGDVVTIPATITYTKSKLLITYRVIPLPDEYLAMFPNTEDVLLEQINALDVTGEPALSPLSYTGEGWVVPEFYFGVGDAFGIAAPLVQFNRDPVIGDVVTIPIIETDTNKKFLMNAIFVQNQVDQSITTIEILSLLDITGQQGPEYSPNLFNSTDVYAFLSGVDSQTVPASSIMGGSALAGLKSFLVQKSNAIVDPAHGGTGQNNLYDSIQALVSEIMNAPSEPDNWSPQLNCSLLLSMYVGGDTGWYTTSITLAKMMEIFNGRNASVTSAGDDYSALRSRAISLNATLPSTGLVNGALYGVYQ